MTSIGTRQKIEDMLAEGRTKHEVYVALGGTDDIARIVAATPDFESRKKYNNLNMVLVGIIIYYAVAKLVLGVVVFAVSGVPKYFFPFLVIVPAVAIYMAYYVKKFYGEFYLVVGGMGLAAFFKGASLPGENEALITTAVQLPLLVGVVIAFVLKKKLCPSLGYLGAKTDASGKYQF